MLHLAYEIHSVSLSPQANCTDWATATSRWILEWSARRITTVVNLGFIDRNRYFFIQVAPQLSSRDWVDPVSDPLLLRKSGSAGESNAEPLGL
jgi:hypothetical protein